MEKPLLLHTPRTSSIEQAVSDTFINNKQNIKIRVLDGFGQTFLEIKISVSFKA